MSERGRERREREYRENGEAGETETETRPASRRGSSFPAGAQRAFLVACPSGLRFACLGLPPVRACLRLSACASERASLHACVLRACVGVCMCAHARVRALVGTVAFVGACEPAQYKRVPAYKIPHLSWGRAGRGRDRGAGRRSPARLASLFVIPIRRARRRVSGLEPRAAGRRRGRRWGRGGGGGGREEGI